MNKDDKRQRSKKLLIIKEIGKLAEFVLRANQSTNVVERVKYFHSLIQQKGLIDRIQRTPAKLFRKDKCKIDKRRIKRYNRKLFKNSVLVMRPENVSNKVKVIRIDEASVFDKGLFKKR